MPIAMHGVSRKRLYAMRLAVYTRDGFACRHCGFKADEPGHYDGRKAICWEPSPGGYTRYYLELDHITPRALGGKFTFDNLQALCTPCNARKGARLV